MWNRVRAIIVVVRPPRPKLTPDKEREEITRKLREMEARVESLSIHASVMQRVD